MSSASTVLTRENTPLSVLRGPHIHTLGEIQPPKTQKRESPNHDLRCTSVENPTYVSAADFANGPRTELACMTQKWESAFGAADD